MVELLFPKGKSIVKLPKGEVHGGFPLPNGEVHGGTSQKGTSQMVKSMVELLFPMGKSMVELPMVKSK